MSKSWAQKLSDIDRRWIFLLIALGTLIPILRPIGFPVSITPPVRAIFDRIETLGPTDYLVLSFDYGPTTAAENAPMADAILRHCRARGIKVVSLALYPLGGLEESRRATALTAKEFPEAKYGVDYINLGYKDGAQPAMRQMGTDLRGVFPTDVEGKPLDSFEIMRGFKNLKDAKLAVSIATGIIGEYWANLVNAQFQVPVAVGCTAVSAPKYYAYLEAKQMIGLMGGLKAASEYERMVREQYPPIRAIYENPVLASATKGMDVQTIDHLVIIAFIVLGNVTFFLLRRRPKQG